MVSRKEIFWKRFRFPFLLLIKIKSNIIMFFSLLDLFYCEPTAKTIVFFLGQTKSELFKETPPKKLFKK
jgi:hypothetical protein